MSNKLIDARAYCPFYRSEGRYTITCEGVIGDATVSRFNSLEAKTRHEIDFCMERTCRGCGVYGAIMSNYVAEARPKLVLRH
ncbi:MAG: hypothetical protein E7575_06025 [Ruminococcaceae bacterium]|nr:hypothetical protein [Oscillospiraceae bacterium]